MPFHIYMQSFFLYLMRAVCDNSCLEFELRLCTGLNEYLCCNVYNNGKCAVECPPNKEPDHNFDCECVNNFTGKDCKSKL